MRRVARRVVRVGGVRSRSASTSQVPFSYQNYSTNETQGSDGNTIVKEEKSEIKVNDTEAKIEQETKEEKKVGDEKPQQEEVGVKAAAQVEAPVVNEVEEKKAEKPKEKEKKKELNPKKLIADSLSELISDNELLQKEIGRQVKRTQKKYPELASTLSNYRSALKSQEDIFTKRLEALGGQESSVILQGVETLAGVASGLFDTITQDPVIKEFRDNYSAFSMIEMSSHMLYCQAIAVGDEETAQIAKNAATENATLLMEIQYLMPKVVLIELDDQYSGINLYASALTDTKEMIEDTWKRTATKFSDKQNPKEKEEKEKEKEKAKSKEEKPAVEVSKSVNDAAKEPSKEPAKEAVKEPVKEPAKESTNEPVKQKEEKKEEAKEEKDQKEEDKNVVQEQKGEAPKETKP
eukprot:TRINITY_DN1250_c1_g3_i3.p1 TRINITY_DN1250_c1_g3~~TRINITY_DN1250_c1_g3_i3.p1  ORF type:complete len:407 (-),score=147.63 TRINITY_DN1250_c1_g3_i3:120-1340(-)